jgi:hypothetical protein
MLVSEIVQAALTKLGVVGHGQTMTAEQLASGVQAFNLMLHGWALDGLDLTLFPEIAPVAKRDDYAATERAPIPSAFLEGTVFSLAARLGPEYMIPFPEPDGFVRRMQAALVRVPEVSMSRTLVIGAVYPNFRRY